jgi:predicted dehydrogenase
VAVAAHGRGHFNTGFADVGYISVFYDDNLLAHFHLNWLSPVKLRRTVIGGSKRMLVWDDLNAEEKIKIYDKGMDVTTREGVYKILASARTGNMFSPVIEEIEALKSEVAYFVECISGNRQPHNNGEAGARVVSVLEATDISLRENGRMVEL